MEVLIKASYKSSGTATAEKCTGKQRSSSEGTSLTPSEVRYERQTVIELQRAVCLSTSLSDRGNPASMEPTQGNNVNGSPGKEIHGDKPRVSETPDAYRSKNSVHGDRPPVNVTVQGQAVSLDNVIADNVLAHLREALIALGATQERTKLLEPEAGAQRDINARLQARIDQLTQRRRDQGQQQASSSLTVLMPKLKDFKSEMCPNRIELLFDDETSSAQRLRIAVAHLDDSTGAMWRHLHTKDEVPAPTWETLRKWLVGTFGTHECRLSCSDLGRHQIGPMSIAGGSRKSWDACVRHPLSTTRWNSSAMFAN